MLRLTQRKLYIFQYLRFFMVKRCKKCNVPLEGGFFYTYIISKLLYLKPSKKKRGVCNHCENKK